MRGMRKAPFEARGAAGLTAEERDALRRLALRVYANLERG
jgi:hypothetical protein